MQPLATPSVETSAVASDATVRPVQRRRAGASPAAGLAARAPEAAATARPATQHNGQGDPLAPTTIRATPTRTRASAGERDMPDNVNGLCPRGIRRARAPGLADPAGGCGHEVGYGFGSSTAGTSVMLAVERPPRSSRTSAPKQAYKRGRCTTTLPGTSARGDSALLHCWFHRCTGASPVWRHHRRVSPFAAVAGRSTRVQVPPVGLQGPLRP